MKLKKIITLSIFLILIPVIFAAVTRNIPSWNCPSGFNVVLTDGGAVNTYGAEETIGQTWNIQSSSHPYTLKDSDSGDGIKQIAFFGISPSEQILYTLKIPAGSYSIYGYYVLDSSGQKPIGTNSFIVHENTCIAGTEDDLDSDGYGKGCSCAGADCCDKAGDTGLGCSEANAPNMNPGKVEGNGVGENDGIDQDCNGCDFVDLDDDNYRKSGTGCGANDCNDGDATINPGKTESNCNGKNDNCVNEACLGTGTNGDCCPSTNVNDLSYYDTNCDCKIDICNPNFITKYLAGEIDPPLQMVIDAIPICAYSNP